MRPARIGTSTKPGHATPLCVARLAHPRKPGASHAMRRPRPRSAVLQLTRGAGTADNGLIRTKNGCHGHRYRRTFAVPNLGPGDRNANSPQYHWTRAGLGAARGLRNFLLRLWEPILLPKRV